MVANDAGNIEAGTCIELFSGGGGLAMSMHDAGFRHLLLNEHNQRACMTLRYNSAIDYLADEAWPQSLSDPWPLVEGDVAAVDFTDFAGAVDVVAAGVPCQPFSLAGAHRGHLDERNMWPEFNRCVREARPAAILAENVRGLLRPSFAPYWGYIQRELAAPFEQRVAGESWVDHDIRLMKALRDETADSSEHYDIAFKLVNAADYGVPQQRWRVFLVGFRKDLGIEWNFPEPTHSYGALLRDQLLGSYTARHPNAPLQDHPGVVPPEDGLLPWRTLRDAIHDLPEPEPYLETPGYVHHVGWSGAREYHGHRPNNLDRPAKTVKAGVHGVAGGELVLRRDDDSIRYLTVREVARLMTFPDDWRLAGPRGAQMRQLGNAVPVELGTVMGKAIGRALGQTKTGDA